MKKEKPEKEELLEIKESEGSNVNCDRRVCR